MAYDTFLQKQGKCNQAILLRQLEEFDAKIASKFIGRSPAENKQYTEFLFDELMHLKKQAEKIPFYEMGFNSEGYILYLAEQILYCEAWANKINELSAEVNHGY